MRQSKIYVALTIMLSFATATHSQTPESIDLGLSVEWAATNLDTSAPEDFGGYYGWADATGQETTMDVLDKSRNWMENPSLNAPCGQGLFDP